MRCLFIVLFSCLLGSCHISQNRISDNQNPAAKGFNAGASDAKAIAIADQVMAAMGGRAAWDDTKIISWNFFGRRHLIWNKATGDVRIDIPGDSTVLLTNLLNKDIKALVRGEEVVHPDSLAVQQRKAESMWINDAYWLLMPFKLKDSGVTLKYIGEDTTQSGIDSDVLQLTFEAVGNTPDNMYRVWVDQQDDLIKQWAFYAKADQEKPPAIWPWDNYKTYGKIKLSADRSDDRGPRFVQVFETLPDKVFSDFSPPSLLKL